MKIIESACHFRKEVAAVNQAVDPELLLDRLYDLIPKYDWFVGEDFFRGMGEVVAYAKFNRGRHLFLREWVYDALNRPGTEEFRRALFVLAHETGHLVLHFRSGKAFARNDSGSLENLRTDTLQEREASIFAGSLIIPTTEIDYNLSPGTVSRLYGPSYSVAKCGLAEARFYQTVKKR
ncbi:MAG: ImmA/IrrE family metallo-endopeptidase [Rhodobacter sp.]|nr:ImmA/IrrE family metallo-endopeptidase [Rhodobacter sp.]